MIGDVFIRIFVFFFPLTFKYPADSHKREEYPFLLERLEAGQYQVFSVLRFSNCLISLFT